MYAGRLVPLCERKAAARLATEKFGVRISDATACGASSLQGGPPSKRGARLIILQEVESKIVDLRLIMRELKLPIVRFMVLTKLREQAPCWDRRCRQVEAQGIAPALVLLLAG